MAVLPVLSLSSPSAARTLPPLWRADRLDADAATPDAVRPTGHAALDAELPGGGWPASGLIELLLPAAGVGELRLLAPALAPIPLLWVAPPLLPYAPALAALGFAPERLVIATAEDSADATWAAEQALRSGTLGAVLWWQAAGGRRDVLPPATLRRLHLAAEAGRTPLFALRPLAARTQSSPAPLRLALEPSPPSALAVDVFKRRGPPMAAPLQIALPAPVRPRRAPSHPPRPVHHAVVRPVPERAAA